MERLLYRLGQSQYHDQFLLKGAMLFAVWGGEAHRPTRDVDLLGFGSRELPQVVQIFQDICQVSVEPDGLGFLPDTMRALAPLGALFHSTHHKANCLCRSNKKTAGALSSTAV